MRSLVAGNKPRTQTELRSLLALVNGYRRFSMSSPGIAAPLNAFVQKSKSPKLETRTSEQTEAFQSLTKASSKYSANTGTASKRTALFCLYGLERLSPWL